MVFLNPEVISGLGEDTFWTWFAREFPNSRFALPQQLKDEDIILRYSTLGFHNVFPSKSVALLWELLPEMRQVFKSNEWDDKILKTYETAKYSTFRVATTPLVKEYYEQFGSIEIIPIGVDTNVFKPMKNKNELKRKYNIPQNRRIGFWGGTTHPMKGYKNLLKYAKENPEIYWIVVWKQQYEAGFMPDNSNFIQVDQNTLAELMNCADFFLSSGLLRPFYMIEWEAMSCNLPIIVTEKLKKDFEPSENPRQDIFELGWNRGAVKIKWIEYFEKRGIKW